MKNQECILLYRIDPPSRLNAIEQLLKDMKFPYRIVTGREVLHPIGYLLSISSFRPSDKLPSSAIPDEMMIMHGLSNRRLNELLAAFRSRHIPSVALKAIVTDTNIHWSLEQLHFHLRLEHAQMQAFRGSQQ